MVTGIEQRITLGWLKDFALDLNCSLAPTDTDRALSDILNAAANRVMTRISKLPPNPSLNKRGGVFLVARPGEGCFATLKLLGEVDAVSLQSVDELEWFKLNKYVVYALAKAASLIGAESGSFSRQNLSLSDSQRLKIGGFPVPGVAILVDGLILSFSGLSMEDDECVVLATAVVSGLIYPEQAIQLASQMTNHRYLEIMGSLITPN